MHLHPTSFPGQCQPHRPRMDLRRLLPDNALALFGPVQLTQADQALRDQARHTRVAPVLLVHQPVDDQDQEVDLPLAAARVTRSFVPSAKAEASLQLLDLHL